MKQYWAILSREDKVSTQPVVNTVAPAPLLIRQLCQHQQATQSTRHPIINPHTNPPRSCTCKYDIQIAMIRDHHVLVAAASANRKPSGIISI